MSTPPDAFDALRADTSALAPTAAFARRLRQQLRADTSDIINVNTNDNDNTLEQPMSDTQKSEPAIVNTVTPYLVVDGAAAAIADRDHRGRLAGEL